MLKLIDIPAIENFPFIEQTFDSPTLYGLVVKIGKELNKTIIQVNKNTEVIDNIDINFDELNAKINELNEEFSKLLEDFDQFKIDIDLQIANRFELLINQVRALLNDYQRYFNAELENAVNELNHRIDQIILGQIDVYNPTNGQLENINKVINDVYDALRYDALTCNEFENLDLTATEFDSVEITAFNFDNNGKSILTNL